MERIAGWVFVYNEYTKNWQAATRENSSLLYNDISNEAVLKSKSINTLIELIIRTQGSHLKLNKLINGKA